MREISSYYDTNAIAGKVANGQHREVIGGLWDEIGRLQFDFLRANGLSPSSVLVDIGCGCLRGGVHFVYFLNAGYYFGMDISEALLRAGYDTELRSRGLCDKLPRDNLICDGEFRFSKFPTTFDFAIAQSLFTHLPAHHIQLCLSRLAPKMKLGGRLFATFFLVPDDHSIGSPFRHPHGICTFDHRDPYHYRFKQVRQICDGLPWCPTLIGDWGHPRDQQIVLFRSTAGQEEDAIVAVRRAFDIDKAPAC
jgi:hypothetical protein